MKELLERRMEIWHSMKALLAATAGRTMSGEEETAWQKMEGDLDAVQKAIKIQERGAELADELDSPETTDLVRHLEPHPATPDGPAGTTAIQGVARTAIPGNFSREYDYARAFDAYLRMGADRLPRDARETLDREVRVGFLEGTGNVGGYTVPTGFLVKLTDRMKAFGGMLEATNVIETSEGNSINWPTSDDTGVTGELVAEAGLHTVDTSTPFGQKTLSSYLYGSKLIKVSVQLLNDSAFDLESWLSLKMGQRLGRIVNQHLTTGTGGGSQPAGIVPGLTATQMAVGNTVSFTYGILIDAIHGVDPAYRPGASWMMSDAAVKVARKLTDGASGAGRPLWEPSLQAGVPDSLLGYPLIINQDVAVPAASAKSIVFGDLKAAYVTRRVQGTVVLRLNELFAQNLQVAFLAFVRYDGVVDDSAAAVVWQQSAT
jgi:HK97 family phage major capsid protein